MPGERSALRVDKFSLRGLETPFVWVPFDAADVDLNALRGVLAKQRALLRWREFGRNVPSDSGNRRERKSGKDEKRG